MQEALLERVRALDEEYFGERSLERLVRAMASQVASMEQEPTLANVHKQVGDLLFVIVAVARNNGWDVETLLADAVRKLENRRAARHYYEAHVTVEPVFDERLAQLTEIASRHGFRVADLLMRKRKSDTPQRSANDSFCTARGISKSDLQDRMLSFGREAEKAGFTVWRYKIESTLLDSRYDDSLLPLNRAALPERERDPRAPADGALSGRVAP